MLLSRDYVGYMAKEIVKRLVAGKMIETKNAENLTTQVRQVMSEEITIEDRLNEEVREILAQLLRRDEAHGSVIPGDVQEGERPACSRKETDPSLICA